MKCAPSLSATPEDWSQLFQVSKTKKSLANRQIKNTPWWINNPKDINTSIFRLIFKTIFMLKKTRAWQTKK